MSVSLRAIDASNWTTCIFLTTDSNKEHRLVEEFVASNAVSLVQASVEPGWTARAIYREETMVGFAMYGYSESEQHYELCRLMIDYRFQQQGLARKAMRLILEDMRSREDCTEIYLSFDPENRSAQTLYEQFGFEDTGRIVDDERLYRLDAKKEAER